MRPDVTNKARNLRQNATEAEKALWRKLSHAQTGFKFRRQHPVQPYIVDFFCQARGLVIEVDGGQHDEQKGYDDKRTAFLESKGYYVLRFWNNEVLSNIEGVMRVIMDKLEALPPLSPLPQARGGSPSWRNDFPILSTQMNGKPLAFLDSAASAQKPRAVIDAMEEVYAGGYANIHRGLYDISQALTQKFEAARATLAHFIGAGSPDNIVFTRNATEAVNLVAQSWGRTNLKAGDEIVLSVMEHHANIVPWQLLRDQIGVELKIIPMDNRGVLDQEAYKNLLSEKTKLIALTHVSNALGTVNPVADMIKTARAFNPEIKVLIDGAQAVVHQAVNVGALDADFYVLTGHKLYGPTGIGALYGKLDLLNAMPPYQGGGDMIDQVSFARTTYREAPQRFEAGTPAIVEAIGLAAGLDYMSEIGLENIHAREQELLAYGTQRLSEIDGLTLYGTAPEKAGILSFTMKGLHASDIGMVLDQCGVAVRTGHHCCMPLMDRLGVEGTIRASLGLYSNEEDIDQLVDGLNKAKDLLG